MGYSKQCIIHNCKNILRLISIWEMFHLSVRHDKWYVFSSLVLTAWIREACWMNSVAHISRRKPHVYKRMLWSLHDGYSRMHRVSHLALSRCSALSENYSSESLSRCSFFLNTSYLQGICYDFNDFDRINSTRIYLSYFSCCAQTLINNLKIKAAKGKNYSWLPKEPINEKFLKEPLVF